MCVSLSLSLSVCVCVQAAKRFLVMADTLGRVDILVRLRKTDIRLDYRVVSEVANVCAMHCKSVEVAQYFSMLIFVDIMIIRSATAFCDRDIKLRKRFLVSTRNSVCVSSNCVQTVHSSTCICCIKLKSVFHKHHIHLQNLLPQPETVLHINLFVMNAIL